MTDTKTPLRVFIVLEVLVAGADLNRRPSVIWSPTSYRAAPPAAVFLLAETYFFKFDWLRGQI